MRQNVELWNLKIYHWDCEFSELNSYGFFFITTMEMNIGATPDINNGIIYSYLVPSPRQVHVAYITWYSERWALDKLTTNKNWLSEIANTSIYFTLGSSNTTMYIVLRSFFFILAASWVAVPLCQCSNV